MRSLITEENKMGLAELFVLAVVLSMDAFAVSVCKGLALKNIKLKNALWVGLWFGAFQAIMPLTGFFLGVSFKGIVEAFAPWIAFALLALIGVNMVREAVGEEEKADAGLGVKEMFLLAVATSIDALAVGVSFAMMGNVNIAYAVTFIGCVTFVLSALGVKVGSVFGTRYNKRAQITGGVVLVLLGLKIILEHFGVI